MAFRARHAPSSWLHEWLLRFNALVGLRSTAAKSGAQRKVALAFTDGDDVILIASNTGQAKNPNWYHNLLNYPECELLPDGTSR